MSSCLVIAGEKSGEDHAMTFLPELMKENPNVEFFGVGGDRLQKLNMKLLYHLKDFSGIGISEVLAKIPFYYKAMDEILSEVDRKKTKTAILIDFQGFNLKLAKKLKARGVDVLYYVAPQAWVWKPWRAKTLQKTVHTLFTIIPFEKKWFFDRGVNQVKGVIHPLMIEYGDRIKQVKAKSYAKIEGRAIRILLLPGSRNVEVSKLLPIFSRGVELIREDNFEIELGIVKSESVNEDHYNSGLEYRNEWSSHSLPEALQWADICIAASGTVTLATGLFGVPTIVLYQVSLLTEFILGLLVPYKGPASLTNIVHGKMVFPELIQYKADRYGILKYFRIWMNSPEKYDEVAQTLMKTPTLLTGDDFSVSEYMGQVLKQNS
ncbi:MAG: hypothetical protein CME65_03905 [Halobacteriovoraceae bacterium]|nr:hypothetical protein [Halobacteriovoraceae bacterium]|tara:strand:+ start:18834 stop:19964 length:1131 start_codon:yes stop_codon:yes gene_type:complete